MLQIPPDLWFMVSTILCTGSFLAGRAFGKWEEKFYHVHGNRSRRSRSD